MTAPTRELVLALDFGGTKLTAALARRGARQWLGLERLPSPPGADAAYDYDTVLKLARKLLDGRRPAAIGVSFGGPVLHEAGMVRLSHHVPGWTNQPLRDRLQTEFGAPARIENDANAAAWGEFQLGAGRNCDSLLYVTVSTGVGGGWILDGKLWHGAEGMAGEFGHLRVQPDGPACVCGGRGCVESLASGPAIAARANRMLQERPTEGRTLRRLHQEGAPRDAKTVAQAAILGDDLAWASLEAAAVALGTGIGSTANLMNPARFVLGGGVSKAGERFWNALRQTARAVAMPEVSLEVVPATFQDDAPLWGALILGEAALDERPPDESGHHPRRAGED